MKTLTQLNAFIKSDSQLSALREKIESTPSNDLSHDMQHLLRVAIWTCRIGGDEIDNRVAIAAALCHDLVNVPKNSPQRSEASTESANASRTLLLKHGFTGEQTELMTDAIRDHSFSRGATPTSALGRALQDADRLDALGAIGIFRTASVATQLGSKFFDQDDPWAKHRELDDASYATDHFFTKLFKIPSLMNTDAGRNEANTRVKTLENFLNSLANELQSPR